MPKNKKQIVEDLINWSELSLLLTGNKNNIRKNRIPKKHSETVDRLLATVTLWYEISIEGKSGIVQVDLSTILSGLKG